MHPIVAVGFLAFFVSSLTVGVRLILLWRRTRELPELLIGLGVLGIGPVGFGLATIAGLLRESSPGAAAWMLGLAMLAMAVGAGAKYVFNWRVYHPQSRLCAAIAWLGAGSLLVLWVMSLVQTGFRTAFGNEPGYMLRSFIQVGCLLWGSAEALRWWRMLRRRMRLGLAEPVVTNRFFLWGLGAGAAGVGTAIGIAAQMVTGVPSMEIPWVTFSSSLHGLTAAVAMWFAFLPSARYLRFIETRAARLAA